MKGGRAEWLNKALDSGSRGCGFKSRFGPQAFPHPISVDTVTYATRKTLLKCVCEIKCNKVFPLGWQFYIRLPSERKCYIDHF